MLRKKNRFSIRLIHFIVFGMLLLGIGGCNSAELTATPSPTIERLLTPYLTATPSPTAKDESGSSGTTPVSTEIPLPTATPVIYAVVANDTLTGIAFRYSITLEDLIAANPGLDPNFLTIGMTLTIPLEGVVIEALPTATPIPLAVRPPQCYPTADGNLQCLAVIENIQPYAVENVAAQISLQAPNGEIIATKIAIAPLNIIPAGQKSAVVVTFEGITSQDFVPLADLLTVIPVAEDDQRYLQAELHAQAPEITADGLQAQVTGSVQVLLDQPEAATVWVAAFAYDENGNVVGFRKWIASDIVPSGEPVDFEIAVYSLGSSITQVDLLVEARP